MDYLASLTGNAFPSPLCMVKRREGKGGKNPKEEEKKNHRGKSCSYWAYMEYFV